MNFFTSTIPDNIIVTDCTGTIISSTKCTVFRKDVADVLKNKNLYNSGWELSIPKGIFNLKKIEDITVYAFFLQENSAYALQNIPSGIDLKSKNVEEQLWMKAAEQLPPDRSKPYYSCMYIEGAIIFTGDHRLNLCCILNLNSPHPYDAIQLGSSNPDQFSLKKILEKRKKIIIANQKEGYPACNGCFLLRKKIWPYRKDLFNYLNLIHSTSCNLLCKFCGISNGKYPPATPTIEVLNCINLLTSEKYLADDSNIAISGGEPALMKGLDTLLIHLEKSNYMISVNSNGTIFSDSIGSALKKGKLTNLIISADAVDSKIYTSIKGKNFSSQVWENICKYAVIDRTKVIPKMIIMEENISEVEPFIQQCVRCCVTSAMFDYDQNIKPNEKIINALRKFEKFCKDSGIIGIPARPEIKYLLEKPDM
jgi:organic radical activating enzyme